MATLGSQHNGAPKKRLSSVGKAAAVPPIILAVVFIIALVFAANNANVISWLLAIVALGWLVLATFVYIGVVKAASFGANQVRKAQAAMSRPSGDSANAGASTRLVEDTVTTDGARDMKLDHSFKIVQVQSKVIREKLAELELASTEHDAAASTAAGSPSAPTQSGPVHSGDGRASAHHSAAAQIARALETIEITAHNGRDMLGGRSKQPGGGDGPAEPISGVVVD